MAWFTPSSRLTLLAVALTLGIVINVPARVQAQLEPPLSSQLPNQWDFSPPASPDSNRPIPVNRDGGGRRDGCIAQSDGSLVALVPASGIGTTVAEYPTVFWYLPKTRAWGVEFVLKDANNQEVYSTKYAFAHYSEKTPDGLDEQFVTGAPGIMSLTLPDSGGLPPLEVGQEYRWQLKLMCDRTDSSGNYYVDGGFMRVEPEPTLASRLAQAEPQEQVALYAEERLWFETLSSLIELRRRNPNDQNLTDAWNKLLQSVGLQQISEDPVFQDARTLKSDNQ